MIQSKDCYLDPARWKMVGSRAALEILAGSHASSRQLLNEIINDVTPPILAQFCSECYRQKWTEDRFWGRYKVWFQSNGKDSEIVIGQFVLEVLNKKSAGLTDVNLWKAMSNRAIKQKIGGSCQEAVQLVDDFLKECDRDIACDCCVVCYQKNIVGEVLWKAYSGSNYKSDLIIFFSSLGRERREKGASPFSKPRDYSEKLS